MKYIANLIILGIHEMTDMKGTFFCKILLKQTAD